MVLTFRGDAGDPGESFSTEYMPPLAPFSSYEDMVVVIGWSG